MIGRILIDRRQYEIELTGTYATLQRIEPPGERIVRPDMAALYSLTTGAWDATEIERQIRRLEQEGLFDKPNTPASAGKGKPTP
ncbi:MAG: hypothetical protein ACYDBJ_18015 [Aggregatilineales bacterium]